MCIIFEVSFQVIRIIICLMFLVKVWIKLKVNTFVMVMVHI